MQVPLELDDTPHPQPHHHHNNNRRRLSLCGREHSCGQSPALLDPIRCATMHRNGSGTSSQALSPTHRLDLDASWIFETTFCAPSPGGLSGLGWPESVPNQENGACSAWKGRGTITDNSQPHPQPMVQLIESENRCLWLLLRLDISNLRFFESFSLFFPQSIPWGNSFRTSFWSGKIEKPMFLIFKQPRKSLIYIYYMVRYAP